MQIFLIILLSLFLSACAVSNKQNNQQAAEINAALGVEYLKAHQPLLAKEKLLLAESQDSRDILVILSLAYYYMLEKQDSLAAQYYAHAIRLAPNNPLVLNDYGVFLCQSGRYLEAASYFKKAEKVKGDMSIDEVYRNAKNCH